MVTLELPYGKKLYLCSICGAQDTREKIIEHEAKGTLETTEIRPGDTVEIFDGAWRLGKTSGLACGKSPWVVADIFYAPPVTVIATPRDMGIFVGLHALCFSLEKRIGPRAIASIRVTNRDFELWMEGNEENLVNAGLIKY